jgi:hypothetical protein
MQQKFEVKDTSELRMIDRETDMIVMKCDSYPSDKINIGFPVVEVKHGLKVEVRDKVLEIIKNHQYVKENFDLNIKRLNRWWYSVYFKDKSK